MKITLLSIIRKRSLSHFGSNAIHEAHFEPNMDAPRASKRSRYDTEGKEEEIDVEEEASVAVDPLSM